MSASLAKQTLSTEGQRVRFAANSFKVAKPPGESPAGSPGEASEGDGEEGQHAGALAKKAASIFGEESAEERDPSKSDPHLLMMHIHIGHMEGGAEISFYSQRPMDLEVAASLPGARYRHLCPLPSPLSPLPSPLSASPLSPLSSPPPLPSPLSASHPFSLSFPRGLQSLAGLTRFRSLCTPRAEPDPSHSLLPSHPLSPPTPSH